MQIKSVKNGELFKLSQNGKIYVRGNYERSSKLYPYYDYEDVNNEHFAQGSREVIVDF